MERIRSQGKIPGWDVIEELKRRSEWRCVQSFLELLLIASLIATARVRDSDLRSDAYLDWCLASS